MAKRNLGYRYRWSE